MRVNLSIANLLGFALIVLLCVLISSWAIGLLIPCLQIGMFALIVFVGATALMRSLKQRRPPASRHIIDQAPALRTPETDSEQVARQIQERIERLRRED